LFINTRNLGAEIALRNQENMQKHFSDGNELGSSGVAAYQLFDEMLNRTKWRRSSSATAKRNAPSANHSIAH
jgi:hypothetical protein